MNESQDMEKETVVQDTAPANTESTEANGNQKQRSSDLRDLAKNVCITLYGYIRELKEGGNNSMGNLIFQEMMNMLTAASLASESIGRDKFVENLERGFYSSGRLLVYLDYCGTLGTNNSLREGIAESVTGIHRIFAASVKTVKSKQTKAASTMAV